MFLILENNISIQIFMNKILMTKNIQLGNNLNN